MLSSRRKLNYSEFLLYKACKIQKLKYENVIYNDPLSDSDLENFPPTDADYPLTSHGVMGLHKPRVISMIRGVKYLTLLRIMSI